MAEILLTETISDTIAGGTIGITLDGDMVNLVFREEGSRVSKADLALADFDRIAALVAKYRAMTATLVPA